MAMVSYLLPFFFTLLLNIHPGTNAVGINYGLLGNNLPSPPQTIARLKQINVSKIRIFQPDNAVLTALHDSGISVIIGTYNEDLQPLASSPAAASQWVETNILPHRAAINIICIAAGNEVFPGELARFIPDAMKNLDDALRAANVPIPVSTAVSNQVLSSSYPPSSGAFSEGAFMTQIAAFLASTKSPLLVNVYPYFTRVADPNNVALEYALFKEGSTVVHDGQYTYVNIFDAMTDAVYAALEKVNAGGVEIVVSETGWPTAGSSDASVENAQTYVNNLVEHVSSGKGTPRRPGKVIETYIFAMFNENLKPEGVEQHWGLHYPDLTEVYHINHF